MKFFTKVPIDTDIRLMCSDQFLLTGSCFTEYIGQMMVDLGLQVAFNPHGILFNPLSVAQSIEESLTGNNIEPDDLLNYNGTYFSWKHHTSVHESTDSGLIDRLVEDNKRFRSHLVNGNCLIITWGTAFYYKLIGEEKIVANCHKQPGERFEKLFAMPDQIVELYSKLVRRIQQANPNLRLLLTISPVRHIKDGFIENQQSKAALILAAKALCDDFPEVISYFPAYEIVMDELRDYRFYAEDMVHPNDIAVKYIWERFVDTYFNDGQINILKEAEAIFRMKNHKLLFPGSESGLKFEEQKQKAIADFVSKHPYFRI